MSLLRCRAALPLALLLLAVSRPAASQSTILPPVSSPATPPGMETIAFTVHEGTRLGFDLSPDGRRLVFDLLGQLWELPSGGGDARPLTDAVRDTAEDLDPSWAPDGRRIVFRAERSGRTGLWLLDVAGPGGGVPRQLTQLATAEGYEGGAAWSPDGRTIAFARLERSRDTSARWRSRILLLDPDGGAARELVIADSVGPDLRDPAWSPEGGRLAVVAAPARGPDGGRLWLVDAATGAATPLVAAPIAALAPAFAPDGRRLAFFAPDSAHRTELWLLDVGAPGTPAARLTDQADVTPTRVRWTPDGGSLVYGADGRLWKVSAAGGAPAALPFSAALSIERPRRALPAARFPEPGVSQHVRAFMGLALSPDARRVALLALGRLWVMAVDGAPRAVADVPLSAHHLAWSPDGVTLAWSAGHWGQEDLFATDVATGATHRLTALPGREDHPAYAPDGRSLLFLHQPSEDSTIVRIVDAHADGVSDPARTVAIPAEQGAEAYWTPRSDGLLYVTGGFGPASPTRATIIRFSGARHDVSRMPDSPLFLHWTAQGLVFVRHARLWRAAFDGAGMRGAPEPLGTAAVLYASAARDGSVLYLSDGGLRLRAPDGSERILGWPLTYTPPVPPPVLIRNARIIDGTARPATPPRDILVERGRISRIAAAGSLAPGAARVLDAGGGWVIPGLMDLHAHDYRPELLSSFSYFGVTTVRDQGSAIGPLVAYADAIAAGRLEGPRVGYGGLQLYSDWGYDYEDGQGVEPEADPEHAARVVELEGIFGGQHVKTRTFRRWDINARFIAEAHRRGMRATGHCAHPLPLVAAGMDAKEHAGLCEPRGDGFIYDDLVQLYRRADIGVVPTIVYSDLALRINAMPDYLEHDTELAPFLPPRSDFAWMLELDSAKQHEYARLTESARSTTAKLARAGVTIGTGSDVWQIPTGAHLELEELVAAGLSPLQAIHAATGGAARILGAEHDLGTIEPGKWADLVILDADPTVDIRNTRRIRAVLEAGRPVDRAAVLAQVERRTRGPGR